MDDVLESMARDLRTALIRRGLDPADPPDGGPPTRAAWAEYQRRGGKMDITPEAFTAALVARVGEMT